MKSLFICDIGDGGSKKDKFDRDIRLLLEGIKEEPNNSRYHFYLANSYFHNKNINEAIEYYKKRIDFGGWKEEVWYSHYRIGLCHEVQGNMEKALESWLNAYEIIPARLENIYKIINYYRKKKNNKLAVLFYSFAKPVLKRNLNKDDYLFLEKHIYAYKIYYEFIFAAFYAGCKNVNYEILEIMNNCNNKKIIAEVLLNMRFYQDILKPVSKKTFNSSATISLNNTEYEMVSSSPCIINDPHENNKNGYLLNVRTVNYKIMDSGKYTGVDKHIITGQILYKMDKNLNVLKKNEFPID